LNRLSTLPDVPTVAETLPGFESSQWFGVLAPARTPRAIVERLHQAIINASRTPDMQEKFASMGMESVVSTPEAFAKVIREETVTWANVVKAAGIKPQ
ncbi:MAG: Bug family tripartite tricarboxylate transporter substrate binding protein, partial [Burkholderiales bacterium]